VSADPENWTNGLPGLADRGSIKAVLRSETTRVATSTISNGGRRSKAQMESLRDALFGIVRTNRPCSVRQVYYVGIGRLWEKDRGGSRRSYNDVVRNLGVMRERGQIPWGWITDTTRYVRIDAMYGSADEAMAEWVETYRRDLWARQPRRVEVWAESDSTASLVEPVTRRLGVGLYSCRGQSGKEFVHAAASVYRQAGKPVTILYCGDWDPSGLAIPRSLEERLRRYSHGQAQIAFRRLAVTPEQIEEMGLTTHDVNVDDRNYRRFADECAVVGLAPQDAVEVEAIEPPVLRDLVESALEDLIDDPESWNATLAAEESERELFQAILEREVLQ
jgi:hypothetical protein